MKLLKLAAAVLNQTPLDWRGNQDRILAAIGEARQAGASVLCLPELCITGYGCEDAFHAPSVHRRAWRILHEIAPLTAGMVVTAGLPVLHQKGLFNFACVMADGKIIGFTGKRFLAGDGIHYEPRWFRAWPAAVLLSAATTALFSASMRASVSPDAIAFASSSVMEWALTATNSVATRARNRISIGDMEIA